MKDRITAGFISGIVGGIAMSIVDWVGYLLGLYEEQLLDWASASILGKLPTTTYETIWSQLGQIFFCGFLGIVFSYLLLKLTSGNYLIKGWLFGVLAWFSIYALSIAIRLPFMHVHNLPATVSHFIAASIYGLTLAQTLAYLDKYSYNILR